MQLKKINRALIHIQVYGNCYLRFFTVYGPWGRPDMLLKITFKMYRDYTYIL